MLIKMKKGLVLIVLMLFLSACNNDEDLRSASSLSAAESDSVPGAETEPLSVFTTAEQEKILEFSSSSIAAHDGGNIDREITGLDFEALNSKEAIFGQWSNDSFTFDTFTYAVEYDGETYTTETNPERFNENFRYIEGKRVKSDQRYKKINLGEQIAETEVTECSYTCESFDSREGIRTEPFRAALTLSGTVTLEGVIAYAEEGDDYWNVYADTVLFFPYADSLKESRIPLLHTEKIDAVYYENSVPVFGFSGETLPFELGGSTDEFYNGKTFVELLGAQKFREATIQFEEVVQSWTYMNGSGWSPCKAKIMKITLISSQHTLESTSPDTSENLPIAVPEYQATGDPAESAESGGLQSDDGAGLDEWLKENLWSIIGNINLANLPEVRDYVNPRSAKLYIADIDDDGNFELIHSLFTGTYTTIDSVYKLSGTELHFYGYYYSGLHTEDSDFIDGVYTNGSEQRYFCSRYVTSGGADQPYWIRIYEIKFGTGIELVPIISGEWSPSSQGGEYCLVKAEYDGGAIYDENEYHQWLSDFLGDYTAVGDLLNMIDSMDVPFSIGAKEFTSDEKEQEIIDWICTGLTKNGEPAGDQPAKR